jgi:hypothetical protein
MNTTQVSVIRMIMSSRMQLAGHVARMGTSVIRIGKRSLGRSRLRWLNSVKTRLDVIRWDGINRIGLSQDMYKWVAFVNAVMNLRLP